MKKYLLITFILICSNIFISCSRSTDTQINTSIDLSGDKINLPASIGDMAYDYNESWGYRIYIKENGMFVPFVVLSTNYNGACLLLREYLLDDLIEYNSPGEYGSYYKNSNVDMYLNSIYYSKLSEGLKNIVINSKVIITSKNAIDTHDDKTETISRKVFILSANEVNASLSNILIKEGNVLLYFTKTQNRIAAHENGETDSWMTRTPALRDGNTLICVGNDGSIGMGSINGMNGVNKGAVRPAFCIPAETEIVQRNDIVEGQNVFCIQ